MKELRTIIRDLREDNDIRQEAIAKHLGVSQQTYSNYENGRREIPTAIVKALAEYYHVSTDYLLSSDTSYAGNVSLNSTYVGQMTMHDIMYDIQNLNTEDRKNLVKYIQFLQHDSSTTRKKKR